MKKKLLITCFCFVFSIYFIACKEKTMVVNEPVSSSAVPVQSVENNKEEMVSENKEIIVIPVQSFMSNKEFVNTVYVSKPEADLYNSQNSDASAYKVHENQPLKLITVGQSVIKNDVNAPMIEVYYPYTKKMLWIFGGDVQSKEPIFDPARWTEKDLENYLTSTKWGDSKASSESFNITVFKKSHEYRQYLIEASGELTGSWKPLSGNSFSVETRFSDDSQGYDKSEYETRNIYDITPNSFSFYSATREKKITLYRVFPLYDDVLETQYDGTINVRSERDAIDLLYAVDYSDFELTYGDYAGANDYVLRKNIDTLVKSGVPVDHLFFMQYINYWYPIMDKENKINGFKKDLIYPEVKDFSFFQEYDVMVLDNLRIRESDSVNSKVIGAVKAGSAGHINQVGSPDWIDEKLSQWVEVVFFPETAWYQDGTPLEETISGWCFGGYLSLNTAHEEE